MFLRIVGCSILRVSVVRTVNRQVKTSARLLPSLPFCLFCTLQLYQEHGMEKSFRLSSVGVSAAVIFSSEKWQKTRSISVGKSSALMVLQSL